MANTLSIIPKINQLLSSHLGQKISGTISIVDKIIKQGLGKVRRVKFNIGDGQKSIGYDLIGNEIIAIDIWESQKFSPDWTIATNSMNIIDLIDPIVNVITTGNTKNQFVLMLGINEAKEQNWNFEKYVQAIPEKSSIHTWLGQQSHTNKNLERLVLKKRFKELYDLYLPWADKFAKKLNQKAYGYGGFRANIIQAFVKSGFGNVKEISIEPANDENYVADNQKDEEQWNAFEEYKMTPDELYKQLETYVKDVATGDSYSLICTGPGGTGKSFTVTKTLKALGFSEISEDIEEEQHNEEHAPQIGEKQYLLIKGKVSPYGTYSLMYQYNGNVIVVDDCDSMFTGDPAGINLVKGATDSTLVRKVSMRNKNTLNGNSDVPPAFEYTGRIIFITNVSISKIDSAVKSRALVIDISLTHEEMASRIKTLLPTLMNDNPKATTAIKREVLDFLISIKQFYHTLDFRTYEQSVKEAIRSPDSWKKAVVNSIRLKNL